MLQNAVEKRPVLPKMGRLVVKEMQHYLGTKQADGAYEAFVIACERRKLDPYSNLVQRLCERIYESDPIFHLYDD